MADLKERCEDYATRCEKAMEAFEEGSQSWRLLKTAAACYRDASRLIAERDNLRVDVVERSNG